MASSLNTITVNGVTYDATTYGKTEKASNSTSTNSNSSLNKDAFLQLLVTQMQYQDPLDPQDNSQYLSQLAQFSSLEQMTNVADGLSGVSTLVGNINSTQLVGQLNTMIGQKVQWTMTTPVVDANGKAVTDDNGKVKTTSTNYEGTVTGVSISDGSPSLIVKDTNGKTQQVKVDYLTRIGTGTVDDPSAAKS